MSNAALGCFSLTFIVDILFPSYFKESGVLGCFVLEVWHYRLEKTFILYKWYTTIGFHIKFEVENLFSLTGHVNKIFTQQRIVLFENIQNSIQGVLYKPVLNASTRI